MDNTIALCQCNFNQVSEDRRQKTERSKLKTQNVAVEYGNGFSHLPYILLKSAQEEEEGTISLPLLLVGIGDSIDLIDTIRPRDTLYDDGDDSDRDMI